MSLTEPTEPTHRFLDAAKRAWQYRRVHLYVMCRPERQDVTWRQTVSSMSNGRVDWPDLACKTVTELADDLRPVRVTNTGLRRAVNSESIGQPKPSEE